MCELSYLVAASRRGAHAKGRAMDVRVQLAHEGEATIVEMERVPRKGEHILHDGQKYKVTSVVYRLDEPAGVVVTAWPRPEVHFG